MSQADLTEFDIDEGPYRPASCTGFTIRAGFGHFRKVGTNSAKPTYRIPPRTTVVGLLAGILGFDRDSYYDHFQADNSAIAIVPLTNPHTLSLSLTTVNTKADEAIKYVPSDIDHYTHGVKALTPESYSELDRQRDPYEMLVDPAYRIYIAVADDELDNELFSRLDDSRYHYSPSLGLSECLAEIRDVERHEISQETPETGTIEVDSAVHTTAESVAVPTPGVPLQRERSPLYMEAVDSGGRRTTEFANVTYVLEEEETIEIKDHPAFDTGRHTVTFS
jgi:CRISPR-associated protein Cas5h